MTDRTDEQIIKEIKILIEENVKPAVAAHNGNIEFVSYTDGVLIVELGGACSGCAGSTMTLKMGVENMLKHYVPEIVEVEAIHDMYSTVSPFYSSSMYETINIADVTGDYNDTDS